MKQRNTSEKRRESDCDRVNRDQTIPMHGFIESEEASWSNNYSVLTQSNPVNGSPTLKALAIHDAVRQDIKAISLNKFLPT